MSDDRTSGHVSVYEDADVFARAVSLLLNHRDDEARAAISTLTLVDPIPKPTFVAVPNLVGLPREPVKPLKNADRARVYMSDGWRCRYCRRKLVVPGILEILTTVLPGFKGLLPGHHMSFKLTERAVDRVYPNVDHVHATSTGGSWQNSSNHVTACTPCNESKNNRTGWHPGPRLIDNWDGLIYSYRALAERAGTRTAYHKEWFAALEI